MSRSEEELNLVHLNRMHFPIRSLGFGSRVGVWFQGCSLGCPGCVSRDTWDPNQGGVEWRDVVEVLSTWVSQADGLTVSGGEPFEQPQALMKLITWWRSENKGDVLVYSGYPWETLTKYHGDIISQVDVLISDPFEARTPQSLPLRGSDNQRMHLLTSVAKDRYSELKMDSSIDVCTSNNTVWLAGIPHQSDMARLRQELAKLGIVVQTSDQLALRVRA